MALVEALETFRVYIFGFPIIALVDQFSVVRLLQQTHPSKFARFRQRVDVYGPTIVYLPGTRNVADWASRYAHSVKKPEIEDTNEGLSKEETQFIVPEGFKAKSQVQVATEQADRVMQIYQQMCREDRRHIDGQKVAASDNLGVLQPEEETLDIEEGSEEYY